MEAKFKRLIVNTSGGRTSPHKICMLLALLDLARGRVSGPFDRTIDVQVGRLRRKMETDPKTPELFKTVRGGGYVLTVDVKRS